jgi:hypothetical protein
MAQTIRITITPDIEKALQILRKSTLGTLNTTELIKMAVGSFAKIKSSSLNPQEMDLLSSQLFQQWSKDDKTQNIDNIAHPEKLKPFTPKPYVRTS